MTVLVKAQKQEQRATGLEHDFATLRRRRMMGLANGVTVAALADEETAVLSRSGLVRTDIRRSFGAAGGFGAAAGVARGVALNVRLRLVSANSGRPMAGRALYLWHADRDGAYSLHSRALEQQNYLRGIQTADENGWVTFSTVFPGAYDGRWPHLRYEVYADVAGGALLFAGQLALPGDVAAQVYGTSGYEESAVHLALASPANDDGGELAMATVTGDLDRGFVATRAVSI